MQRACEMGGQGSGRSKWDGIGQDRYLSIVRVI